MKQNLYWIHLISTEDMEVIEFSRMATGLEKMRKEADAIAECYNLHGYNINMVRIFSEDKELLISYNVINPFVD